MLNVFHPALYRLLWLTSVAAVRNVLRQMRKPAGFIFGAILIVLMLFGIGPSIWLSFTDQVGTDSIQQLRQSAGPVLPLMLLSMTLFLLVTRTGDQTLELRPAELHFILAGPFSDRQILTFRLMTLLFAWLPTGLVFCLLFRAYSVTLTGLLLAMSLGVLYFVLLGLASAIVRAVTPGWFHYLVLGLFVVSLGVPVLRVATAIVQGEASASSSDAAELFAKDSVGQWLVLPFRGISQLLQVQGSPLELFQAAIVPAVCCVGLLLICYLVPVSFTELAAFGVERRTHRMSAAKSGSTTRRRTWWEAPSRIRRSVPDLPSWGDVGPIYWMQLVLITRRFLPMLLTGGVLLVSFSIGMRGKIIGSAENMAQFVRYAPLFVSIAVSYLGLLAIAGARLGFSMPIRQLDWFRTLPTTPWKISLGLSAGGWTLLWIVRVIVVVPAGILSTLPWHTTLAAILVGLVADAGLFSALNAISTWSQLRIASEGPPDILQAGRAMVLMMLLMLALIPQLLLGGVAASIVGLATEFAWTRCLLAAAAATALYPPLLVVAAAWGFERGEP